jgi:DNA-binding NarL/FixJ family response regulator
LIYLIKWKIKYLEYGSLLIDNRFRFEKMDKPRLLIADDHRILLDGIAGLLRAEGSFEVADTAMNGYEVLELTEKNNYDLCLLDISMPKLDGLDTARLLRQKKPGLKIIMLTTYNDKEIITELIHIGVSGYLLKNSGQQELVDAIKRVMAGRYYFSEDVEKIIIEKVAEKQKPEVVRFTGRELEVFELLIKNYNNNKTATQLHISPRTVETHRKNIMQKTNTHSLAELIQWAYKHGFVK